MKIIVDADACPRTVLLITIKLGQKYKVPVWSVASFNHNIETSHHVIVGNADQETDTKIMNLAEKGDIIVTQDWGLAAMILGKKAFCLSPSGKEYLPEKVDFLLEERALKAKHRRAGGRTKGPKKRQAADDKRFEAALDKMLTCERA